MSRDNSWQDPCEDMLKLIVSKVSYFDLDSFSAVCSSWHKAAKTYRRFSRAILLSIIDNQTDSCVADDSSSRFSFCLRSLADGKVSRNATIVAVPLSPRYNQFYSVGWSKDMLVLADKKTRSEIVVIDRFYRRSFCLPPVGRSIVKPTGFLGGLFVAHIVKVLVLVTSEKKSGDEPNMVLVAIFGYPRNCLACYMSGSWMRLDDNLLFLDIVARERQLFALESSSSVQIWDFNSRNSDPPTMVWRFKPSEPFRGIGTYTNFYLVGSIGEEFLLVNRHLSRNKGKLLPKFGNRDCNKYRTKGFQVYKSRLRRGEKWTEVDSLGDDIALFLGWNESVSVSIRDLPKGYEGNSIYFTHNFYISNGYGSHEMGVYSLEHRKIKFFDALDEDLDGPTPVWMVSNNYRPED